MRILLTGIFLFIQVGCSAGAGEEDSSYLPDLPIECTAAQVSGCAGTSLPVFIGWIKTTGGIACDDFLTGLNGSQRRQTFDASTTLTSSRRGIYLTGLAKNWDDQQGSTIRSLAAGTYQVCAFVDSNSNGLLDTNEPVGSDSIATGQSESVLKDWFAAYN